jgi:ATP-dependent Clp protease ATP-binding subunit ClpX
VIGFGANVEKARDKNRTRLLREVQPQDLLKYGLIPEFIGRLPIVVNVDYLDESDIIRILTEPKNAFVKQYKKFFSLDDVDLEFEEGALKAIAVKALSRGTGARGLKSIIEEALLNSMFEVPSRNDIRKCVITEASILAGEEPEMILGEREVIQELPEQTA